MDESTKQRIVERAAKAITNKMDDIEGDHSRPWDTIAEAEKLKPLIVTRAGLDAVGHFELVETLRMNAESHRCLAIMLEGGPSTQCIAAAVKQCRNYANEAIAALAKGEQP